MSQKMVISLSIKFTLLPPYIIFAYKIDFIFVTHIALKANAHNEIVAIWVAKPKVISQAKIRKEGVKRILLKGKLPFLGHSVAFPNFLTHN
jgi:hypothetical protein